MRIPPAPLAVMLAVATGVTASRLHADDARPYDFVFVPRPEALRLLFLGNRTLAANLTWLQAVQYIGDPKANERGWDRLYPVVDAITDLDPGHGYAYQVAGVLLSSLGRIDESNRILEKGARNVPDRYILPFLRAFNAFYYADDWPTAGRWAEAAARAPGAPPHVRETALAYYVKGKRADAAVGFLEQSLAEARDPDTRKAVEKQLKQARLELEAAKLDEAVEEWRRRYVAGPLTLGQLVAEGLVPAIAPDPKGGELYLGDDGRVRSTADPFRFSRPEPLSQRPREPGVQSGNYGGLAR